MSQRDKGLLGGTCKTEGCETTGARGIVGQANMYASGDEMNRSHRCSDCRTLVNGKIYDLLIVVSDTLGLTEKEACVNPIFIDGGKLILRMTHDELRGKR